MSTPTPEPDASTPDNDQTSEAGSGFGNSETAAGGADAVPDDPDINRRPPGGSGPGTGEGPRCGLERAREQRLSAAT